MPHTDGDYKLTVPGSELPPFVSVVVPTRNRAGLVATCVESLLAQDYPPDRYELLVVVDGSTDSTTAILTQLAARTDRSIQVVNQAHLGPNAARNNGIRRATGDPICLVDDDQELPPTWLSDMVAGALAHPEAGCLGGPIRLKFEGKPPRMCGDEPLGESELDLGTEPRLADYLWGGNLAMRRSALGRVGLLREDLLQGGTEVEWEDRLHEAGIPIVYLPGPFVWHRRTASDLRPWRLAKNRFFRGRGQAINALRLGKPYEPRRVRRAVVEYLRHAASRRCATGVVYAAQEAGRLAGTAEWKLRRMGRRTS